MTPVSPDSMPTVPAPDWDALARYQAGESDDAERAAMARWMAEHPGEAAVLGVLAGVGSAPSPSVDGVDVEAAIASVKSRFGEPASPRLAVVRGGASRVSRAPRVMVPSSRRGAWVAAIAAAVAASVALAVGLRRDGTVESTPRVTSARAIASGVTVASAVGARDSVLLPDGTFAMLGPGSRVTLSAGYGGSTRELSVDGVVLFRVRHDAQHPFVVRAGNAVIRDIGTVFVVRSGTSGITASVAVSEGSVGIRAATSEAETVVRAGDRAELRGTTIMSSAGVADSDLAWTRGELVYRDTPLFVVRDDLRRWYGVDLQVSDTALARRTVTARFAGESADRVLNIIALALGGRIERHGATAELRSAGGGSR